MSIYESQEAELIAEAIKSFSENEKRLRELAKLLPQVKDELVGISKQEGLNANRLSDIASRFAGETKLM